MSKKHRRWALAAVPVLGLVFFSTQQTGALWSSTETIAVGDTITSGKLDIAVGNSGSTQSTYPFTALAKSGMTPDSYVQAPLTVRNSGNVMMKYRMQNGGQSNSAVPLTLTVSAVADEAACPSAGSPSGGTQLYSGALLGAQMSQLRTLAPGASEVLCMRGAVGATPPQNASTTATFTFAAEVG